MYILISPQFGNNGVQKVIVLAVVLISLIFFLLIIISLILSLVWECISKKTNFETFSIKRKEKKSS